MIMRSNYAVWVDNRFDCFAFTFQSAYKRKDQLLRQGKDPKRCFITRDDINPKYLRLVPK